VYRETALPKWPSGLFIRLAEGAVISCTAYSFTLDATATGYSELLGKAVSGLNDLREQCAPQASASSDVAGSGPDLLS
jgi:hypothetical protein